MLQDRVQELHKKFSAFPSWEDKYKMILHYGKKLETLPEQYRIEENLVPGCLSKVWLHAESRDEKIHYFADSDAQITKGIIGLLLFVYNDLNADEILSTPPDFLKEIGVDQHISMNRRNGLVNMCKLIFAKANELKN